MTDLDRLIAGVDIARKAAKRRKAQAFTAQEEPIVIGALAAAERMVAGLMECAIVKDHPDAINSDSPDNPDSNNGTGAD